MDNIKTVMKNVIESAAEYHKNADYCRNKIGLSSFELFKMRKATRNYERAIMQAIKVLLQEDSIIKEAENNEAQ